MNQAQDDVVKFEGEDPSSGFASPLLDLIAAIFLALLSVAVMIASLALPVPGDFVTAPGLLPFLVGGSLLIMAAILGFTAIRRRRSGVVGEDDERDISEYFRALGLATAVAVYIAGLHFLAFQSYQNIGGFQFTLSAFEPVTIVALSVIISISWRGPLWASVLISVVWTVALSLVFQKMFTIPLPGGF